MLAGELCDASAPEIQAELAATHARLASYTAAFDMAPPTGTRYYWNAWRLSGTAVQFVDLCEPGILAQQKGQRVALKPLAVEAPLAAWRELAIGDFNTCRAHLEEAGAIDPTAHYMDAIDPIGFRDLWRPLYPDRREYSWFSTRNNGFRIDHAFLSQELAACAGTIHYPHEERIAGFSDYSPLILELAA